MFFHSVRALVIIDKFKITTEATGDNVSKDNKKPTKIILKEEKNMNIKQSDFIRKHYTRVKCDSCNKTLLFVNPRWTRFFKFEIVPVDDLTRAVFTIVCPHDKTSVAFTIKMVFNPFDNDNNRAA